MKLIAIVFTEWRDAGQAAPLVDAASRRRAEAQEKERTLLLGIADLQGDLKLVASEDTARKIAASNVQLLAARQATREAMDAEGVAGDAAQEAMRTHPMVGKTGYQVLSDDGTEVMKVVDADGNDLPAGAQYGYRVADPLAGMVADAALPVFAVKANTAKAVS